MVRQIQYHLGKENRGREGGGTKEGTDRSERGRKRVLNTASPFATTAGAP